jgi:bisphosphoglycerate-independent phosphoglycerate mutase (AlkP superfamily)
LLLVNFREPDYTAHQGDWQGYVDGIQNTDEFIFGIYEFLSNDPFYDGRTSVFITNDHGRHLDGVGSGFSSHGDDCEGCRHVFFYAQGPDFKNDVVLNDSRSQTDITATVAHLLDIEMPYCTGEVMEELFE